MDQNIVNHIMGIRRSESMDNPIQPSCSLRVPIPGEELEELPLKLVE